MDPDVPVFGVKDDDTGLYYEAVGLEACLTYINTQTDIINGETPHSAGAKHYTIYLAAGDDPLTCCWSIYSNGITVVPSLDDPTEYGKKVGLNAGSSITIKGASPGTTIKYQTTGSRGVDIFGLSALSSGIGVKLVIDEYITLEGRNTASFVNSGALVVVGAHNTFEMEPGSAIKGHHTRTDYQGAGVYVGINGTFNMRGGEISGNINALGKGGGVAIHGLATLFSKTGGTIYGSNEADPLANKAGAATYGAAVYVEVFPERWHIEDTVTGTIGYTPGGGVATGAGWVSP
jgi:hypothetical protein